MAIFFCVSLGPAEGVGPAHPHAVVFSLLLVILIAAQLLAATPWSLFPFPAPTCTSHAVLEGTEFQNQISNLEKLGTPYSSNTLQF